MKPHPHKDVIIAYANGETIQTRHAGDAKWVDVSCPSFYIEQYYRVKPKEDIVKYLWLGDIPSISLKEIPPFNPKSHIRVILDGETGFIKHVEKLG